MTETRTKARDRQINDIFWRDWWSGFSMGLIGAYLFFALLRELFL